MELVVRQMDFKGLLTRKADRHDDGGRNPHKPLPHLKPAKGLWRAVYPGHLLEDSAGFRSGQNQGRVRVGQAVQPD